MERASPGFVCLRCLRFIRVERFGGVWVWKGPCSKKCCGGVTYVDLSHSLPAYHHFYCSTRLCPSSLLQLLHTLELHGRKAETTVRSKTLLPPILLTLDRAVNNCGAFSIGDIALLSKVTCVYSLYNSKDSRISNDVPIEFISCSKPAETR